MDRDGSFDNQRQQAHQQTSEEIESEDEASSLGAVGGRYNHPLHTITSQPFHSGEHQSSSLGRVSEARETASVSGTTVPSFAISPPPAPPLPLRLSVPATASHLQNSSSLSSVGTMLSHIDDSEFNQKHMGVVRRKTSVPLGLQRMSYRKGKTATQHGSLTIRQRTASNNEWKEIREREQEYIIKEHHRKVKEEQEQRWKAVLNMEKALLQEEEELWREDQDRKSNSYYDQEIWDKDIKENPVLMDVARQYSVWKVRTIQEKTMNTKNSILESMRAGNLRVRTLLETASIGTFEDGVTTREKERIRGIKEERAALVRAKQQALKIKQQEIALQQELSDEMFLGRLVQDYMSQDIGEIVQKMKQIKMFIQSLLAEYIYNKAILEERVTEAKRIQTYCKEQLNIALKPLVMDQSSYEEWFYDTKVENTPQKEDICCLLCKEFEGIYNKARVEIAKVYITIDAVCQTMRVSRPYINAVIQNIYYLQRTMESLRADLRQIEERQERRSMAALQNEIEQTLEQFKEQEFWKSGQHEDELHDIRWFMSHGLFGDDTPSQDVPLSTSDSEFVSSDEEPDRTQHIVHVQTPCMTCINQMRLFYGNVACGYRDRPPSSWRNGSSLMVQPVASSESDGFLGGQRIPEQQHEPEQPSEEDGQGSLATRYALSSSFGSTSGPTLFIPGYNLEGHTSSLQGLQTVLFRASEQVATTLQALVLHAHSTMKSSIPPLQMKRTRSTTFLSRSKDSSKASFAPDGLAQSFSPYQVVAFTDTYTTNLEQKVRSGRVSIIATPTEGWSIGFAYDCTKETPSEHHGMSFSTGKGSVKAKTETDGCAAVVAWNTDKAGFTGHLVGSHGWGKVKNTRSFTHGNETVGVTGRPDIRISGGLAQVGYTFPISTSLHCTPYIACMVSVVKWNPYNESSGAFLCTISPNTERVIEDSLGLHTKWALSDTSHLQGWIAGVLGHRKLERITARPLAAPIDLYEASIPCQRKQYIKGDIGISYKVKLTEGVALGVQGKMTFEEKRKRYGNQHIAVQLQYTY